MVSAAVSVELEKPLALIISSSLHRVEKYRPATLDDLVSHKDITATSE